MKLPYVKEAVGRSGQLMISDGYNEPISLVLLISPHVTRPFARGGFWHAPVRGARARRCSGRSFVPSTWCAGLHDKAAWFSLALTG